MKKRDGKDGSKTPAAVVTGLLSYYLFGWLLFILLHCSKIAFLFSVLLWQTSVPRSVQRFWVESRPRAFQISFNSSNLCPWTSLEHNVQAAISMIAVKTVCIKLLFPIESDS
jgi:hypothetical protein